MSNEQSIRDELARNLCSAEDSGSYSEEEGTCTWHFALADQLLASPVIRRIQAEAWDRCVGEMPIDLDWKNFYGDNNPYRGETA